MPKSPGIERLKDKKFIQIPLRRIMVLGPSIYIYVHAYTYYISYIRICIHICTHLSWTSKCPIKQAPATHENSSFEIESRFPFSHIHLMICRSVHIWAILQNCDTLRSLPKGIFYVWKVHSAASHGRKKDLGKWQELRMLRTYAIKDSHGIIEYLWYLNLW